MVRTRFNGPDTKKKKRKKEKKERQLSTISKLYLKIFHLNVIRTLKLDSNLINKPR
jgi:hypothetical protein